MFSIYVLVAVVIYIAALIIGTWYVTRKESAKEFASGNFKIKTLGTFSSQFVSTIDGTGLVLLVSLAAAFGFGLYWFVVGIALAALLFYIHAPKVKELMRTEKFLTPNDFFRKQIGKKTNILALFIISILVTAHFASLLHVSGQTLSAVFGTPLSLSVVAIAALVGIYMYVGGYKTVIFTDVVQFFSIVAVLVVALFVADFSAVSTFSSTIFMDGTFRTVAGTVLFFALVFYTLPAMWQRLFTARDTRTVRRSLWWYVASYIPIYFVIITFAVALFSQFPDIAPNEILYALASGISDPLIGSIIAVALLAMTMSSIDTQAYLSLSTITSNWMGIDQGRDPEKYKKVLRGLIIAVFAAMTVVALTITDVVNFIIGALSLLAVLTPAYFVATYSKGSSRGLDTGVAFTVLIGIAAYFYMFTNDLFTDFMMNAIPGLVTVAAGIIIVGGMAMMKRSKKA